MKKIKAFLDYLQPHVLEENEEFIVVKVHKFSYYSQKFMYYTLIGLVLLQALR